jgi:hypothetical protein
LSVARAEAIVAVTGENQAAASIPTSSNELSVVVHALRDAELVMGGDLATIVESLTLGESHQSKNSAGRSIKVSDEGATSSAANNQNNSGKKDKSVSVPNLSDFITRRRPAAAAPPSPSPAPCRGGVSSLVRLALSSNFPG